MNRFDVFNEGEKDVMRMALRRFYDQLLMEDHENQTDLELDTSILYYELMQSINS